MAELFNMDLRTVKHSISKNHFATTDKIESINNSSTEGENKNIVSITKCLCDPCPRFYTDKISGSILIHCTDPKHTPKETNRTENYEN